MLLHEELALPRFLVVEEVAHRVLGDVHVDQEEFAVLDAGIGVDERHLSRADGLDLGAREDDPAFPGIEDEVLMGNPFVAGDDLDAFGHAESPPLGEHEIDPALQGIRGDEPDLHDHAYIIHFARGDAKKDHLLFVEFHGFREGGNVDEAFDGVREFDEHPELRQRRDDAFVDRADLRFHEFGLLHVEDFALAEHRGAFRHGGGEGDVGQEGPEMGLRPFAGLPFEEIGADQAVDGGVRITPDRGGEVGVVGEGEAVVAPVFFAVAGFRHRPQHHHVHDLLEGRTFDLGEERLEVLGLDDLGDLHRITHLLDELEEGFELLGVRVLVDAVEEGEIGFLEMGGDGLVGHQHEFLDDAFADPARLDDDVDDSGVLVKDEFRFDRFEVDGALLRTQVEEDLRESFHFRDDFGDVGIGGDRFGIPGEDPVHLGVGHLMAAVDHRGDDFVVDDVAVLVDFHQAGDREAVDLRIEGADAVGKFLRQHRDDAVRQVVGGSPPTGVLVEVAAFGDVMGNVGDVDPEGPVAVGQDGKTDGVVDVLRVVSVDGEDAVLAEIATPLHFFGQDGLGKGLGGRKDRFGEFGFHAEAGDDFEDFDAGGVDVPDVLDDEAVEDPHRGIAEDLRLDDRVVLQPQAVLRGNFEKQVGIPALGEDRALEVFADDVFHRPFEDDGDFAFEAGGFGALGDADEAGVPVHGVGHAVAGDEDVGGLGFPFDDQKAEAAALEVEGAADEAEAFGEIVAVFPATGDLPFLFELGQGPVQFGLVLGGSDAQKPGDAAGIRGPVGFVSDQFHDLFFEHENSFFRVLRGKKRHNAGLCLWRSEQNQRQNREETEDDRSDHRRPGEKQLRTSLFLVLEQFRLFAGERVLHVILRFLNHDQGDQHNGNRHQQPIQPTHGIPSFRKPSAITDADAKISTSIIIP